MRAAVNAWAVAAILACLVATSPTWAKKRYPPVPVTPPAPPPALPVTLPIYATFNLPATKCSSIILQPEDAGAWFQFLVSNDTATTWDQLFPTAAIAPGNVDTQVFTFHCTNLPSRRSRALRVAANQQSTVTIHSLCYLPDAVTLVQAAVASSLFVEALTKTFMHSPLTSMFNITLAQVTTLPSLSLVYCTGTTYSALCYGGTNVSISWWNSKWLPTTGK